MDIFDFFKLNLSLARQVTLTFQFDLNTFSTYVCLGIKILIYFNASLLF
jgi:hypothetical protein